MEGIYFEVVIHAPPHHHGWLTLTFSFDLQLITSYRRSSLELVRLKLDLLLHENISHVEELIYIINSIQEGFNIKIPTNRRNANFHVILIRICVSSFLP